MERKGNGKKKIWRERKGKNMKVTECIGKERT